MTLKICPQCGCTFQPRSWREKYCQNPCTSVTGTRKCSSDFYQNVYFSVEKFRAAGWSWPKIGAFYGRGAESMRVSYQGWLKRGRVWGAPRKRASS